MVKKRMGCDVIEGAQHRTVEGTWNGWGGSVLEYEKRKSTSERFSDCSKDNVIYRWKEISLKALGLEYIYYFIFSPGLTNKDNQY
jgi:hypothetical protein